MASVLVLHPVLLVGDVGAADPVPEWEEVGEAALAREGEDVTMAGRKERGRVGGWVGGGRPAGLVGWLTHRPWLCVW